MSVNLLRLRGIQTKNSPKKHTIALSTTEAEYMAISTTVQESLWLRAFEEEFYSIEAPIKICCDNISAMDLAKSNGYSARTKYIDIRHHFIRQHIDENRIILVHVPTEDMIADVLTKPLFSKKHLICSQGMGLLFH